MKVHLRQRRTWLYYAGPQQWTAQATAAVDFGDVDHAISASRDQGLTDVDVVLSFEDGRDDPSLSVPPDQ